MLRATTQSVKRSPTTAAVVRVEAGKAQLMAAAVVAGLAVERLQEFIRTTQTELELVVVVAQASPEGIVANAVVVIVEVVGALDVDHLVVARRGVVVDA